MSTIFGVQFNENYLWAAILIGILIVCCLTLRREGFEAPFIPAQPWIEFPEYPAPYRGDRLYLGGSTKCFSCEKDMIKRGMPTYLAHPTKCFDCDAQAIQSYGTWAGHFGQNNKCFSCEAQYAPNPFKLESIGTQATPYCHTNKKTRCNRNKHMSRFGRADGQSYDDDIQDDGVGLVHGFGAASDDGGREGDTMNPMGYTLN